MHRSKYAVNMYGNIYFVVNIKKHKCYVLVAGYIFSQLVVVNAVVAAVYSGLTIKFYKEVLDSKERQTDTVRMIFFTPLDYECAYKCV